MNEDKQCLTARLCCYLYLLQTEQQLDCALDLMRRLPPQQIEKNLSDLIDLVSASLFSSTNTLMQHTSERYDDLKKKEKLYYCFCEQFIVTIAEVTAIVVLKPWFSEITLLLPACILV